MNEIAYENPWFKVEKQGNYHFVSEAGSDRAAVILAIKNGRVALLETKRPAQEFALQLEIPRGGANEGETGEKCALRELTEETGFQASPDHLMLLGHVRPNTAILTSRIRVYVAMIDNDAVAVQERDNESVGLRWLTMHQVREAIMEGLIEDAFTLSALTLFQLKCPQGVIRD